MGLDLAQAGVVDAPGGMRANRFEHVLHGQVLRGAVLRMALARHDRAAVEDDGGDVQARRRHRRGGDGLVAADQQHHRVQAVAIDCDLDRVGDHLARGQRIAHAFAAHRDAVGDGDGVELHRSATACLDAFAHVLGQVAQGDVARRDVGPGADHRNQRLGDGRVIQPGGAQHGACGGMGGTGFDGVTSHELDFLVGKIPGRRNEKPRAFLGRGVQVLLPGLFVGLFAYTCPNPAPLRTVIRVIITSTRAASIRPSATVAPVGAIDRVCGWLLRCVMEPRKPCRRKRCQQLLWKLGAFQTIVLSDNAPRPGAWPPEPMKYS